MNTQKLSFEESLNEKVLLNELCMGCGACVLVCPFACLEYVEEKPNLIKECETCGICARVCPRYDLSQATLEKLVFGRKRKLKEDFGCYRRLIIAQTNDERIRRTCQDGGLVTTLLTFAMNSNLIDSAIVSAESQKKPLFPIPTLANTPEEILRCAGTKYSYSPNLLALQQAVQYKKNLGFVGTPCQIQTLRKIEAIPLKKYSRLIKFTIGLMCTESFTYEGLFKRHIQEVLGINLSDVQKINIKGKILVKTTSGEIKTIPLSVAKQYARKGCLSCPDFSAELADISAGGLGLDGWTFAIIRTKKGEEIFDSAEKTGALTTRSIVEEKNALKLLIKLSKMKSTRMRTQS